MHRTNPLTKFQAYRQTGRQALLLALLMQALDSSYNEIRMGMCK